jgi:hypothetical protein
MSALGPLADPGDLVFPTTCAALRKRLLPTPCPTLALVGRVDCLTVGHCYSDFVLDDSTDRVPVRFFHGGDIFAVPAGYVRVVGRVSRVEPTHILTEDVSGIRTADEIPNHLIEAALAHLRSRPDGVDR